MSDTVKKETVTELAEAVRGAAGEDAETRWRAEDARKAAMELAHTAASLVNKEYMRQRIEIDAAESVELPAHRNRVEVELVRQGDALVRIAAALEQMASK
jgi:plasmid stabilization system protein ParE